MLTDMLTANPPSPELMHELGRVRPGVLTAFVSDRDASEKIAGIVREIAFGLGIRYTYEILETDYPPLQWALVARRASALDPEHPRYSIVNLGHTGDPLEAGHFLRKRLFDVIDDASPMVELYRPVLSPLRQKSCTPLAYSDTDDDLCNDEDICSVEYIPGPADETPQEADLEDEKKRWVDALSALMVEYMVRFHEAPPMELIAESVRGKFLLNASRKSPVTVSGDMKIYLPELNEIQLRMTPLATTVYILFLCHPEGIRLKDIGNYRHELAEIYSMVKPGCCEEAAEASIDELVNPLGNSLQEKLSMTRRAVRRYILDRSMAENYLISGERGGLYRIALDPELIRLPQSLKQLK